MTTALYRRYRPETFADVIGQEHVTEPLMAAIAGQRVSHAYLFSGPRGCGKTTSARILARCLNCAQGPTPTPCGVCDSCLELARGGSGSLDVVEIDAASHNGVDDARELRERAVFAPARDRFKIFILDEAHMVTPQGFNALLKLVEEPPEHVKFVFATTEPEKVIGTIRSRTHHYPFRLVPPEKLQAYLEQICTSEGVEVGAGVLALVVRAGGGSVRDSLSVLDQLLAGADGVLDYAQAAALLGYTPATLLDDVVEALAAADGASVFRVVDRVIESGHDPRRFVEDVLERLRDLIVIVAAGERAGDALRGVPADQFQRMRAQADHLGLAQLSRAADLTSAALTEMTGATSPRLHLELLCARLLLPAADEPLRGFGARIERLEHWMSGGGAGTAAPSPGTSSTPEPTTAQPPPVATSPRASARSSGDAPVEHRQAPSATREARRAASGSAERSLAEGSAAGGSAADRSRADGSKADGSRDGRAPEGERSAGRGRSAADGTGSAGQGSQPAGSRTGSQAGGSRPSGTRTSTSDPGGTGKGGMGGATTSDGTGPGGTGKGGTGGGTTPGAMGPGGTTRDGRGAGGTEPHGATHGTGAGGAGLDMTSQGGAGSDDPSQGGTGPDSETLRRRWPEVLDTLSRMRRSTWILVSQNAQVQTLAGTVLRLRFDTAGIASTFRSGPHAEAVQRALRETLGLDVRVEAVVEGGSDGSGGPGRDGPAAGGRGSGRAERTSDAVIRAAADWADPAPHPPGAPRAGSRSGPQPEGGDGPYDLDDQGGWQADPATVEAGGPPPAGEDGANGEDSAGAAPTWRQQEEPAGPAASRLGTAPQPRPDTAPQPRPDAAPAPGPGIAPAPRPAGQAASRPGGQAAPRPGDGPAAPRPSGAPQQEPDLPDEPDFSDEDLEESYLVGAPLVEQVLGGTLIDDIPVDPAGSSSPDGT